MRPTQRSYSDIETNEKWNYQVNDVTGDHCLKMVEYQGELATALGTECHSFYACGFDSVTIKINNKKEVKLSTGDFYTIKEGEKITHKKYAGFKRFTKLK